MSDLLIAAGIACEIEKTARALSWSPRTKIWSSSSPELAWIVTRVDNPVLWAPATDPASGITALIGGRLAFVESEWSAAERLPYEGGLACRIVIDCWLNGGATAVESLNGGALIVLIDQRSKQIHIWSDRLGFFPAFASFGGQVLICSHQDVLAKALRASGRSSTVDFATISEFLYTGTATHPHTYWREINQLDAATHYVFGFGAAVGLRQEMVYWKPAYSRGAPYLTNRGEAVERLTDALKSAVRRRTLPRLGKTELLLSAGADSRAALFAACNPQDVRCFTLYDEENPEFRLALELSNIAGARHSGYKRTKNYYFDHALASVRVTAGMWSMESSHFAGFVGQLGEDGFGSVLTGCYADYMFKGIAYNRQPRQFLGRNLPIYRLAPFKHSYYTQFVDYLAPDWKAEVAERLGERYSSIEMAKHDSLPDVASRAEFLRLSPIVREPDASCRLFLRRTTGFDPFTADNDLVELFGMLHPRLKVSGVVFGMAVDRLCPLEARRIPNNNYYASVGASEVKRASSFILAAAKRKLLVSGGGGQPYERDVQSVATVGSWPFFSRVIQQSGAPESLQQLLSERGSVLLDLMDDEHSNLPVRDWAARDACFFMRLYTVALWLDAVASQ